MPPARIIINLGSDFTALKSTCHLIRRRGKVWKNLSAVFLIRNLEVTATGFSLGISKMPKKQQQFKYKCLELLCNAIIRHDKWQDHCKKKHPYKLIHNLDIKYKIIESKSSGEAKWKPYRPIDENPKQNQDNDEEFRQPIRVDDQSHDKNSTGFLDPLPSTSFQQSFGQTTPPSAEGSIAGASVANEKGEECFYSCDSSNTTQHEMTFTSLDEEDSWAHERLSFSNDPNDPCIFSNKRIHSEDIELALRLENQNFEPTFQFPSHNNRRFSPNWRFYKLSDGTKKERKWLVYSASNDAAYCLHCLLFALPNQHSMWSSGVGYQGWRFGNALRDIEVHEASKDHLGCQVARLQWLSGKHVNSSICKIKNQNVQHQREVLSVVIDCCKYLVTEMIAFRKNSVLDGKLLNLFKLLAKHNPDARIYHEKIEKARKDGKKLGSNFLSYRNVFDLIEVMNNLVIQHILSKIQESNTFSVIVDSTQDVSKREVTTLIIRYVEHSEECIRPIERLLKVFTVADTSGVNLKLMIMEVLKEIGLNPKHIIGQSMDGAANMRGAVAGLKTLIQKESNTAFYVWCTSHRFALVIEQSINICPEIKDLFSVLEEVYRLFASGHKRHDVLVNKLFQKEKSSERRKRLKRVQTTRWQNKAEAIKTILVCFNEVKSALLELQNPQTFDSETVTLSKGILNKLNSYETIIALHIARAAFHVMHPVTVSLQGMVLDYGGVQAIIKNVKSQIFNLRSDEKWDKVMREAETFAKEHDVPEPTQKRTRKRKRFIDELGLDEPIVEMNKKLKVELYFKLLDSLHSQLEDRFSDHSLDMVKEMVYFTHAGVLETTTNNIASKSIQNLCDFYDWDSSIVCEELNMFGALYFATHSNISVEDLMPCKSRDMTQKDHEEGRTNTDNSNESESENEPEQIKSSWITKGFLKPYRSLINFSGFTTLKVVYVTLLSLAVTSCSAERAMSRVKIVKNRLRSAMGDAWLSNLMVLASEKDVLESVSNEAIIDAFSLTSGQRKKLLCKV